MSEIILAGYAIVGAITVFLGKRAGEFRGMQEGEAVSFAAIVFLLWPLIVVVELYERFADWLTG